MRISMTVASIVLLVLFAQEASLFQRKLKEIEERVKNLIEQKAQVVPPVEKEEKEEQAGDVRNNSGVLQTKVKNAVVQVFSQVTEFNWVEPYKTLINLKVLELLFL